MRAILIEDEAGSRENFARMLKQYCPQVQVVAEAANAAEGQKAIKRHRPDVIFLDIEMPRGSGFDLLESFREIDFELIFVTAYDHYALKAIKFCALDYLLKPVDIGDLKSAVAKVQQRLAERGGNQQLQAFLHNLQKPKQEKRLALPTSERIDFVSVEEIVRCKGENNYTHFHFEDGTQLLVSKTLKEYEELLTEYDFVRVHQSHLISLRHVRSWVKQDGGYILMDDDSQIPVSQRRKDKVFARLREIS